MLLTTKIHLSDPHKLVMGSSVSYGEQSIAIDLVSLNVTMASAFAIILSCSSSPVRTVAGSSIWTNLIVAEDQHGLSFGRILLFEWHSLRYLWTNKSTDAPNEEQRLRGNHYIALRNTNVRRLKGNVFGFDRYTDRITQGNHVRIRPNTIGWSWCAFD